MSAPNPAFPIMDHELALSRTIDAPRETVFKAWTDPELLKQWFAPLPWTTPHAETDVRPGGSSLVIIRSPDGAEFSSRYVYLEVVKHERLVFTDAYTKAWEPSDKPFMTVILTFQNEDGKTLYTARTRRWTIIGCQTHETMGIHQGWSQCTNQLVALVENL